MGAICQKQETVVILSIQESEEKPWANTLDLMTMDQTGKYECSMPFHTLRVDLFEGNVKRMVRGKEYVTVRQLRYAFKYCTQWRDHIPFLSLDAIEPP
jgi:hypothetical protein